SAVPLTIVGVVASGSSASLRKRLLATNTESGERTTHAGERAIYEQARQSYQNLAEWKADQLEDFFEDGRRAVQLQTALVRQSLKSPPAPGSAPAYSGPDFGEKMTDAAFMQKTWKQEPYSVWHLSPGVAADSVKEPVARLARLGDEFAFSQRSTP